MQRIEIFTIIDTDNQNQLYNMLMVKVDERMYGYKQIFREIVDVDRVYEKTMQYSKSYTLFIVTAGAGQLFWNAEEYGLLQGSCFIFESDSDFCLKRNSDVLEGYRLIFAPMIFSDDASIEQLKVAFPCRGVLSCNPLSRCIELIEGIYNGRDIEGVMGELQRHIQLQELLLHLISQNHDVADGINGYQAIKQSLKYIKSHYNQLLKVDDLAEQVHLERWRYARLFKQITGTTPLDYINQLRMSKAKHLLSSTEDRLYDIAGHIGLSNEYYFSKKFKKTVGVSPGQYRLQCRDQVRVFSPFMEDYLMTLGIVPVVQCYHEGWGKQDYLGLDQLPYLDIKRQDPDKLNLYKPDVIVLDQAVLRWKLEAYLQVAPHITLPSHSENWRKTLASVADMFGKTAIAEEMMIKYDSFTDHARRKLERRMHGQTVAMLRLSSKGFILYGGENHGYTGPVLYGDLALEPHLLVERLTKGLRNVALTTDQLALLDADHLFIAFDNEDGSQLGRKHLLSPVWRNLPAVRDNRVYNVDFFSWMNYGLLSNRKKIDDVLRFLG